MSKNKHIPIATFISHEQIERKIYFIRGKKVMLDSELAALYEVRTNVLSKAVERNLDRFPEDFMFQLSEEEAKNLRLQNGASSWGGRRYLPRVFTDYGILILSSVLSSQRAIHVNIQIMRTYAKQFQVVFKAVKLLLDDRPSKDFGGKRFDVE